MEQSAVMKSKIEIARNLKGYSFPHKLSSKEADIIIDKVKNTLSNSKYEFILHRKNDLSEIDGYKFVASTREKSKNIKLVMKNLGICDRINVVIGPEGGLSIEEEDMLNKLGFSSITLGNRILRVETVPLFILSVINYEFMEWYYGGT